MNAKRFAQVLASTLGGLLFASMLILSISLLPSNAQAASFFPPVPVVPVNSGEPQINSNPPFTIYLPIVLTYVEGCSTIPTLISPTNGSILNTRLPLFQWDGGHNPNATNLHLEVSRDYGFTQIYNTLNSITIQGAGIFRFPHNFDPAVTYYWRAFLICGNTQGPYSELWSFTISSGGTIPPAPTLVAPANGNTVPTTTVLLQWSPVPGAVDYKVSLGKAGSAVYGDFWVTDPQFTITGLIAQTTYEWYVSARNDYAYGPSSVKWQFTTPAGFSSVSIGDLNHSFVVDDGNSTIVFER